MVVDESIHAGRKPATGVVMTQRRKTEDVICKLIRQAISDARFHVGAALAMIDMGSIEGAIQRNERALSTYREAEVEFVIQYDSINSKRRNNIDAELNDVCRKIWIATASISRMAKSNVVVYNQLRGLRRSFLIPGGIQGEKTQAIGGR